jgi:hypothetical protein
MGIEMTRSENALIYDCFTANEINTHNTYGGRVGPNPSGGACVVTTYRKAA